MVFFSFLHSLLIFSPQSLPHFNGVHFITAACDNVQPGYRLERNVRYSYNNLAFLNFSIVPNIEKCARNCTEMPRCVGFSVFNKICYLKHKLGMKIKSDSSDTYVKCGFKKLLNSPPKQYPPKDPSPPSKFFYLSSYSNMIIIPLFVPSLSLVYNFGSEKRTLGNLAMVPWC